MRGFSRLKSGCWIGALAATVWVIDATVLAIDIAQAHGLILAQAADGQSPRTSNQQNRTSQNQEQIETLQSRVRDLLHQGNVKASSRC